MDDRWEDFNFEEPSTPGFLNLPNSIMEHILGFLDSIRDKREACLIHRQWTMAAQNVLWAKHRFAQPLNFRRFIGSINSNRKMALLVRNVYLNFLDKETTLFKIIAKSKTERHDENQNPLANPNFLIPISRCERLQSLTIYGWNLTANHIEKLLSTAQNLNSLSLVGANPAIDPPPLSSLFPRLLCLCLDGDYQLNIKWAEALITRATRLTRLQISVEHMALDVLIKICSERCLPLTHFTLTGAHKFTDWYTNNVCNAFPQLKRFCIEGSLQVSYVSIIYAVNKCPQLTSLEIRAQAPVPTEDKVEELKPVARLERLLLENMNITDDQLSMLSPCLPFIRTICIKNCPQLTNEGIERAVHHLKYLRVVQIIDCQQIDSGLFAAFASLPNIARSLFRVHLENSGVAHPTDIYQLSCAGAVYNLREIRLVGYPNIQASVIGSLSDEQNLEVLTLNRTSIDAITHSTDPELCPVPEGRTLSGLQLLLLSKHFSLSVDELNSLLDKLEEESKTMVKSKKVHHREISFGEEPKTMQNRQHSRLYALQHQSSSLRPTTPSIWHNDFQNNVIPSYETDKEEEDDFDEAEQGDISEDISEEVSEQTSEDNNDYGNDYEDDYVDHAQNEEEAKWAPGPSHDNSAGSEINLGGWGSAMTEEWNTQPKQQSDVITMNSSSTIARKPMTSPPTKNEQDWTGFVEDDYKNQWQQSSLQVNKTKATTKFKTKHYRNSPIISDSDGWGSVKDFVPWDNVKEQGFVKDVIKQQQETTYWRKEGNTWLQANASSSTNATNEHDDQMTLTNGASGSSTPAVNSPPLLFSDVASGLNKPNSKEIPTSTRKQRTFKSRPRAASIVSSDGSISWNEDNNTTILTGSNVKQAKSKPNKVESKWSNAEEWKATKEVNNNTIDFPALTSTTKTSRSSWQNHFAPNVIADKNAKNEWSSLTAQQSSSRRTFSRRAASSTNTTPRHTNSNSRDNAVTQWADYTNGVSPPFRASTSPVNTSTLRKSTTPEQTLLIDTAESNDAAPSRGDVWDSISTLEMPTSKPAIASSEVLVPQQTTTAETEIIDWPVSQDVKDFYFVETVSGTITESEINDQQEQQKKDHLVDFDLLSGSLESTPPLLRNTFHEELNLLNMDAVEPTPGPLSSLDELKYSFANDPALDDSPLGVQSSPVFMNTSAPVQESSPDIANLPASQQTQQAAEEVKEDDIDKELEALNTPTATHEETKSDGEGNTPTRKEIDANPVNKFKFSYNNQTYRMKLYYDDDVEQEVKKFVEDLGIADAYKDLLKYAKNSHDLFRTKIILRNNNAKKKALAQ